jgi:hypothetical protein
MGSLRLKDPQRIWDVHNAKLNHELSRERKYDVVSVNFSPGGVRRVVKKYITLVSPK